MVRVKLRVITPLFLGGSDPGGNPELRPSSFRGVLRFWLRALLGGVVGDDPKEVFRQESRVFGNTDYASPVVVKMERLQFETQPFSKLVKGKPGIAYLFSGARRPERSAIVPEATFAVTLQSRGNDEEALHLTCASLWLLTHLGGLGYRSRRGAGSLQVEEIEGNWPSKLPLLLIRAHTPKQLCDELREGLKQLRMLVGSRNSDISDYDVLHPLRCQIWIVNETFRDWMEALEAFGCTMQGFRRRRQPDYTCIKSLLLDESPQNLQVQRVAFGLPIVFYFRSQNIRGVLRGADHDRRASPLFLRVSKLTSGECVLTLLWFQSHFLPPGERIVLKKGRKNIAQFPLPSIQVIEDFLSEVDQQVGKRLEVKGW